MHYTLQRALALLTIGAVTLSACTPSRSDTATPAASRAPSGATASLDFNPTLGGSRILLINRFSRKLTVYDTTTASVVSEDDRLQSFTYALAGDPPMHVTIGSSDPLHGNRFQLARMTRTSLDTIAEFADKDAFPLARSTTTSYYVLVPRDAQGKPTTPVEISSLTGTKLHAVARVDAAVGTGATADGRLWYTTYTKSSDSYALRSLALDDLGGTPRPDPRVLRNDALTTLSGRLILDGRFSSATGSLDCSLYCLPDPSGHRVFRMGNTTDGDLLLEVVDVRSGRRSTLTTGDIIDIELLPSGVRAYLNGAIRTFTGSQLS